MTEQSLEHLLSVGPDLLVRVQRPHYRGEADEDDVDAHHHDQPAVEAWGWKVYPSARAVLDGERDLTDEERAQLLEFRELASDALGGIALYAGDDVRKAMSKALTARADFTRTTLLSRPGSLDLLNEQWKYSWQQNKELHNAIRREVGIE